MANSRYPKFNEALLSGQVNLLTDDVRVILVDSADYTYSGTHQFLSDVPAAARVSTSAALTGKTVTNGTFDANDVTLSAVTGDQSEALIIYIHTGTEGTSRLVLFEDTGVTGLPVTPNSGNIDITWPAQGIFGI